MRSSLVFLLASLVGGSWGRYVTSSIKNLIVFGDSYSDEGRFSWIAEHNDTLPPPGTVIPTENVTASGGYTWPHYAAEKLGATTYNYAVSGAVCSNEITPRFASGIDQLYPAVIDYEVPAFKADVEYSKEHKNSFIQDLSASVYAIYIGTNDLGEGAFLTDAQVAGKTISDYIDCIWSSVDGLYKVGARKFVLFSTAPLDVAPLYIPLENGGSGNVNYWENKTAYNVTEYQQKIREYTTTVNTVLDCGSPFNLLINKRWPGASVTIFNVHQVILDIRNSPEKYLSAPANVTGFYADQCSVASTAGCVDTNYPLSSFLWYDSLHPSQATEEVVGNEFAKAAHGTSTYATYYSS
ncbi:carbohydrate esterase family 16 protein [Xylariaceae sp. FL0255]|nr:carbohydrate esterase family 16 protein [Xylariaceae sp. FL0255]